MFTSQESVESRLPVENAGDIMSSSVYALVLVPGEALSSSSPSSGRSHRRPAEPRLQEEWLWKGVGRSGSFEGVPGNEVPDVLACRADMISAADLACRPEPGPLELSEALEDSDDCSSSMSLAVYVSSGMNMA